MTPSEFFVEILARLRAMTLYYETAHWQAGKAGFYSDHLLFERLYDTSEGDIDGVAERAVGLSSSSSVDLAPNLARVNSLLTGVQTGLKDNRDFFKQALKMEQDLVSFLGAHARSLSPGSENLAAGIADSHESSIYLIKQRLVESPTLTSLPPVKKGV